MTEPTWRKSSKCDAGLCVEVAYFRESVLVRDSRQAHSPVLVFDRADWQAFLGGVKAGTV